MSILTRVSDALVAVAELLEHIDEGRVDLGRWTLMSPAAYHEHVESFAGIGADVALQYGFNPFGPERRSDDVEKVRRLSLV